MQIYCHESFFFFFFFFRALLCLFLRSLPMESRGSPVPPGGERGIAELFREENSGVIMYLNLFKEVWLRPAVCQGRAPRRAHVRRRPSRPRRRNGTAVPASAARQQGQLQGARGVWKEPPVGISRLLASLMTPWRPPPESARPPPPPPPHRRRPPPPSAGTCRRRPAQPRAARARPPASRCRRPKKRGGGNKKGIRGEGAKRREGVFTFLSPWAKILRAWERVKLGQSRAISLSQRPRVEREGSSHTTWCRGLSGGPPPRPARQGRALSPDSPV